MPSGFTPPTDSVYKFMALSGVFLTISFLVLFARLFTKFTEGLYTAKRKNLAQMARSKAMLSWLENVKGRTSPMVPPLDEIKERDATIQLACDAAENSVDLDELEFLQRMITVVLIAGGACLSFSIGLSVRGFESWYRKIQLYQDRLLVAQVEEQEQKVKPAAPTAVRDFGSGNRVIAQPVTRPTDLSPQH
jgi:hypothetical protein